MEAMLIRYTSITTIGTDGVINHGDGTTIWTLPVTVAGVDVVLQFADEAGRDAARADIVANINDAGMYSYPGL